ncbi:hypothetical protein MKX07_005535 [Trichoderma sp. CBMAI-0711]|uniref:Uncharacterized protein n=1 Tax=Trichoderma parareesei TaxID=858221 RepID=A0A2H2ZHZ0_TRIPA|nr:hypothetical protein MKX07_005535 [Trichoderma sp. CBMAI-0711]OTA05368.1 hypothetical protein A9Z42_0060280 [Trichoderma parareesei]
MSAAIAMAPSPAPHERSSFATERPAPPTTSTSPPAQRNAMPSQARSQLPGATNAAQPSNGSPKSDHATASRPSPNASRKDGAVAPKIVVKKEPVSPGLPASRPRPRRLDLSKNTLASGSNPPSGHPMTARDGLGIQEVGIACLSPGFMTQDPVMKEQLQRSMTVREQQRSLIEARLQLQQSAKGDGPSDKDKDSPFAAKTPGMSRRNKAPPGLSIVAPSHQQFANERVIQSAPLGRSFTGQQMPPSRHVQHQASNLSSTSHIHHVHANQTTNRLPPISDVFGQNLSAHPDNGPHTSALYPSHAASRPQLSPGLPPAHHQQQPMSGRLREYKSAEEAQQELAGGRPELLPRLVHYGGPQPPTPPSPIAGANRHHEAARSTSRRRTRAEYEEGSSPPLGHGPAPTRRGPFGAGRDSPETQRAKKEEFLQLCARAWDLFHS